LFKELLGKLIGDKGYISGALTALLCEHGLQLVIKIKRTMRQKFLPVFDRLLLRKRAIIETVIAQLKEHLASRAFTASLGDELRRQRRRGIDRLHVPRKEADAEH
jgi:hypothetical protein